MMKNIVSNLLEKVIDGRLIDHGEALQLAENAETKELLEAAAIIRNTYRGNRVNLCGVMNIKSGKCSEDCRYCSQSHYYMTNVKTHDLIEVDEVVKFAKKYQEKGINCFGISTSGKAFSDLGKERVYAIYEALSRETTMRLCGAHGLLKEEEAYRLKEAGLCCYQHNLQTSRPFFTEVCTTHAYDDRVNTIKYAQKAGLDVCSGGIMGLGETMDDRIAMMMTLRELHVMDIPVNILNPIPGTPLGEKPISITREEVLRTIAIYRFIIPKANFIYGAGRVFLEDEQHMVFKAGMSGIVVGDFLTTPGNCMEDDIKMLKREGFILTSDIDIQAV